MAGNNINIGVGADVSGLKTGMDSAAKTVQDAGKKMESAAKEATAKTETSFKNLSQAYRATARDAYEIALQQGTQSAAFREAITTAGQYKDELDQVKNSINVLSSDTPILTGALGLGQGLAGAFSAAQGAMALFGAESEDVQKALLKVQGAMALTQGLQAVGQLGDAFSSFADVLDAKVLPALQSMGALLAANPVGVVVTAVVGLSVAYAALADNTDRAAKAERNYVEVNFNASTAILERAKQIQELNKELLIEANAKQKGISVDKERVNLALKENEVLQPQLDKLKETLKLENASNDQALLNNINKKNQILSIENQVRANQDLISAYKEKIRLEGIINAKDPKSKGSSSLGKVTFTPIVDPTAIEDLTGLFDNVGSQLSESLDGMFSPMDERLYNFTEGFRTSMESIKEAVATVAVQAFGQLGTALGQSLAGVDTSLEQVLGNIADTLGNTLLAIGAPMLAIPGTQGLGAAYMAGGFALKAVAGFMNSQNGKKPPLQTGSSVGGGVSGNRGFSGFTPNNSSMVLSTRLIGTDLLMSVQKAGQQNTRVR